MYIHNSYIVSIDNNIKTNYVEEIYLNMLAEEYDHWSQFLLSYDLWELKTLGRIKHR